VLINTSGGLTDGDEFTASIGWGRDTTAIVTTQASERFYKTRAGHARIVSNLEIAENACALWLPQETIMFDGGAYERKTLIDMPSSATLVAIESTMFGRKAMGEVVTDGWMREIWQVRIDGRLAFVDAFELGGEIDQCLERRAIANGAKAVSTIVFVGRGIETRRDRVNEIIESNEGLGRASSLGALMVVRLFAQDIQSLRELTVPILDYLLIHATRAKGHASLLPRVWLL
jgi:urease accessory protein